jgi:hypothetical protein
MPIYFIFSKKSRSLFEKFSIDDKLWKNPTTGALL